MDDLFGEVYTIPPFGPDCIARCEYMDKDEFRVGVGGFRMVTRKVRVPYQSLDEHDHPFSEVLIMVPPIIGARDEYDQMAEISMRRKIVAHPRWRSGQNGS